MKAIGLATALMFTIMLCIAVQAADTPVPAPLKVPDDARAFMFTYKDAKPFPGFTAVLPDTLYDKDKKPGFGWTKAVNMVRDGHVQDGYPNLLDAAGVRAGTFTCDLPDGHYLCSVYMGGLWRADIDLMNHVVTVDGRKVVDDSRPHDKLMDEEYFRTVSATLVTSDDLAHPGLAVWDRYIAPRFRRHDFEVDIKGGQFVLELQSGYVNGVIIFPEKLKDEYAKALKEIDEARKRQFVEMWAEFLPTPIEDTAFRPTDADRQRGYVPFARHWMKRVQYAARPQVQELNPTLRLFATPGEYEPVTFSIWPLRDLKNVRVTVDDLEGPGGAVVPANALSVWFQQIRQHRRARPCTAYTLDATYLPDWDVRDLYKDITTNCWLELKLPTDAAPGIYTGLVHFTPEGAPTTDIPIRLRVLNFKLIRPEALYTLRNAGQAVIVPYPSLWPLDPAKLPNERNKLWYRAMSVRDLYEHGFEPEYSAGFRGYEWVIRDGKMVTDWDKPNALNGTLWEGVRINYDVGAKWGKWTWWFDAPGIGDEFIIPAFEGRPVAMPNNPDEKVTVERIGQWLEDIERRMAPFSLNRIYLAVTGEESHFPPGKGFEAFLAFNRFVSENRAKRWPHIYTAHTCNTSWGQAALLGVCTLPDLAMFHGATADAREVVEAAKATGNPYGIYGLPGRIATGFYFWRTGAYAAYHEFHNVYFGTPNNDWDNHMGMDNNARQVLTECPGWCNSVCSPTGRMVSTWFWEELREGIDDHAYMHTLEETIERTEGFLRKADLDKGREHAITTQLDRARKVLAEITDAVEVQVDYSQLKDELYRPFAEEDFDGLRWKAALATERLVAVLAGKPVVDQAPPGAAPAKLVVKVQSRRDPAGAAAPSFSPLVVTLRETKEPPTIDGKLDDACWREKLDVASFYDMAMKKPNASPRTTASFTTDGKTLFIGVVCEEPTMDKLRVKETADFSDNLYMDDSIEIFLDPDHSHNHYYQFMINAAGVRSVTWHPQPTYDPKLIRKETEKNWTVKTQLEKDRWTLEVAIPLAEFEVKSPCFGLNVNRNAPGHGLWLSAALITKGGFHTPDEFMDLYMPGASARLTKVSLGFMAAEANEAEFWLDEGPQAKPLAATWTDPDGKVRPLPLGYMSFGNGKVMYRAGYQLGRKMGNYQFTLRSGDIALGTYTGTYRAAFFDGWLTKSFYRAGGNDALEAEVRLASAPERPPMNWILRARVLQDQKVLREGDIFPLDQGRHFLARFDTSGLAVGVYDLELTLTGPDNHPLKRTLSEFEILPAFDK